MLDRLRGRWGWLDTALDVHARFGAIGGAALAASIALSGFLSLFPLLLVGIAVMGFVSAGDVTFAHDLVDELGLEGRAAEVVNNAIDAAEASRRAASVIGVVGLLWSGLGVVGSLQAASNAAWQVHGRGMLDKAYGLVWLSGAAVLFLATIGLGTASGLVPGVLAPLFVAVGVALNILLFTWTFSTLGNQTVGWRSHLPGAILAGIGFELLKLVGTILLPRSVASSSALYGTLGVVFAVLAWLALYGRLIVYAVGLNVVRYEAAQGTVTVELEVPRVDGQVPLTADRGGAVDQRAEEPAEH